MNESNGLLSETIKLSGRAITVSEATYMMGMKRGTLIAEADVFEPDDDDAKDVALSINVLKSVYAPLAACSSGDVPTPNEFFKMREADIEEWTRVARKLNSHWFKWLDEVEKMLDEDAASASKKKRRGK